MFARHSCNVNPAPSRVFRQLSRMVNVDELVRDQVNVQTMFFVQLENTQSLQIRTGDTAPTPVSKPA